MIICQSDEGIKLDVRLENKVVCRNFRHTTQHGAVEGKYQVKTLTPVEEAYLESINTLGKLAKRKGKQKGEQ